MKKEYVDQRTLFVDSLYNHLKKETEKIKAEYRKYASSAYNYITSGLSETEAIELLIVDGLNRSAAQGYVSMAQDLGGEDEAGNEENEEFSFVFEDVYGNVFTSHDIERVIVASSHEEAFRKACSLIGDEQYEIQSILSVDKV